MTLTMSVMMKSTRPISIERVQVEVIGGLGELVGDDGGHRVLRREERQRDLGIVSDDHRHGHRLAERAAEAQHDRADDARCARSRAASDRLPARRAQRVGRLALRRGTAFRTSRATDDVNGITMMARISAADEHPDAQRRAPRRAAAVAASRACSTSSASNDRARARRCPTGRTRSTESPRAARSGTASGRRSARRAELREEDRDAERDRSRDQQRENRRVERAPDERQRAEIPGRPDPTSSSARTASRTRDREPRLLPQLVADRRDEQDDEDGEGPRPDAEERFVGASPRGRGFEVMRRLAFRRAYWVLIFSSAFISRSTTFFGSGA